MQKILVWSLLCLVLAGCTIKKAEKERLCSRIDFGCIIDLLPKSVIKIEDMSKKALEDMNEAIEKIGSVFGVRTFHNTIRPYDSAKFEFILDENIFSVISTLHSDQSIRLAALKALRELRSYQIDVLSTNAVLYKAFNDYKEHGNDAYRKLSHVNYFLEKMLERFKIYGLHLPIDQRIYVQQLQKQIDSISGCYLSNISYDKKTLVVSLDGLQGMDPDFVQYLQQDEKGNYLIAVDEKNFFLIMENCLCQETRKEFLKAYAQRGCPQNKDIVRDLVSKRSEMANVLGFKNYASYQIQNQMFKSVKKLEMFLWEIVKGLHVYDDRDFSLLTRKLPPSVTLNEQGKLKPWDEALVKSWYRKQNFSINDRKLSQYFPLHETLDKMLVVFKQSFDIEFEKQNFKPSDVWAPDLLCYRVFCVKKQIVLGYIFFDLFKREGKDIDFAAHMTLLPAIKDDCSLPCVGASVVVGNFEKRDTGEPVLLDFSDVLTLFHEFGHAMHALLGSTHFVDFVGTSVCKDFVEVPSIVFEKWLQNPEVLKMVSCHYKTKKPLSCEQIEALLVAQNFSIVSVMLKQLFLSLVSLTIYTMPKDQDLHSLVKQIYKKVFNHIAWDDDLYYECNFDHIINYGSCYYSYVVADIIAADLYKHIVSKGVFNSSIGQEYIKDILMPGASANPLDMLKQFLKRPYNSKAYFEKLNSIYIL